MKSRHDCERKIEIISTSINGCYNKMYTYKTEELAPLKAVELKKILGGFCLSKSGTKAQMVARIIKYQEDEKQKKEALAILLGAVKS